MRLASSSVISFVLLSKIFPIDFFSRLPSVFSIWMSFDYSNKHYDIGLKFLTRDLENVYRNFIAEKNSRFCDLSVIDGIRSLQLTPPISGRTGRERSDPFFFKAMAKIPSEISPNRRRLITVTRKLPTFLPERSSNLIHYYFCANAAMTQLKTRNDKKTSFLFWIRNRDIVRFPGFVPKMLPANDEYEPRLLLRRSQKSRWGDKKVKPIQFCHVCFRGMIIPDPF